MEFGLVPGPDLSHGYYSGGAVDRFVYAVLLPCNHIVDPVR